jgi:hypothetical protein
VLPVSVQLTTPNIVDLTVSYLSKNEIDKIVLISEQNEKSQMLPFSGKKIKSKETVLLPINAKYTYDKLYFSL